jgi:hypothetical protein
MSWALDKLKVVKPAPTAALHVHLCQGREHPSVRETWCVSKSETPQRRLCLISLLCVLNLSNKYVCVCFIFSHFHSRPICLHQTNVKQKFCSLFLRDTQGEPPSDVVREKYDPAQLLHSPPPGDHHGDDFFSMYIATQILKTTSLKSHIGTTYT